MRGHSLGQFCIKDSIFVKKTAFILIRIQLVDIQFLKADNVYLEVNTVIKKRSFCSVTTEDYLKTPS